MSRPRRRAMKADELLEYAVKGPSFSLGFTKNGNTLTKKEANELATDAYRIWSDTWLTPLILELVPELKTKEDALTVIRKVRKS